jgi:carbamoyl-phosphate synthase large subunit
MNVLLSCVGRRSYIVEYFKETLRETKGKVIGTNSEADTTGMHACDISYVVPSVTDSDYIDTLVDICNKESVKMIVSLFDIDLPYLAKAKQRFKEHGVTVVVSSEEVIDTVNDKFKTYQFLKRHDIATPRTYCSYDEACSELKSKKLDYPLFVKPRWGMGSIGICKADSSEELQFYYKNVKKQIASSYLSKITGANISESVLIQESIEGKEYHVDIFHDLNGDFLISIEKEKLAMRAGETDGAVVVEIDRLSTLAKKVSTHIRHIGNLDMDVLYDGDKFYALELNARFGGGFPFSYLAGANLPKLLVDLVQNNEIKIPNIEVGTKCLKTIVPIRIN